MNDQPSSQAQTQPQQNVDAPRFRLGPLGKLSLEISIIQNTEDTLQGMLTACTEALVRHLDAAFARIWLLNETENVLELQSSSGMYTHLDGAHARVPVGALKIGLIASERVPHMTNDVISDPLIGDKEWARREGMVAFTGYPLLVGERLIGVLALFTRYKLGDVVLQTIETIANGLALAVERLSLLERERHARTEAENARQRLTLAQQAAHIGTFEWDIQTNAIFWTPELEVLYGLPPGGFEGKYKNWEQRVHPDDLQQAQASLQGAVSGGPPYNTEFRVIWPDGTERWLLAKGEVTHYDDAGRPRRMIGVNIDITERKLAEQEVIQVNQRLQDLNANLESLVATRTETLHQLNTELQRSNQELQDFAYVASHDLQEPLRKIQAFGNLLEEEYGKQLGEGKSYLDRMRNSAGRMRVLIEDLLTFSRVTTKAQPFAQVDLNVIMHDVIDDLSSRLQTTQGNIEVEGDLPTLEADPRQMYQMLQNLLGNALKFHQPGQPPHVRVHTELRELSDAPKEYMLFVEDSGIGFDEKYLDRIFTVFQRLHGRGSYEGTGIGLAVVRKIVERHGGTITASSTPGKGSTFIVTLPACQTSPEKR